MNPSTSRDMHLLNEVTRSPDATQRELSRRIGVALGLTNLMLRRLAKKGYIKVTGTKRSRIQYLITPTGILEKSRLTYEFIQYSLQLYGRVRHSLREQLVKLASTGRRKILLYGTGELAEIAYLTIREMGLQVVGVTADAPMSGSFLDYPIRSIREVSPEEYDWVVVTPLLDDDQAVERLRAFGLPAERLIQLHHASLSAADLHTVKPLDAVAPVSATETVPASDASERLEVA